MITAPPSSQLLRSVAAEIRAKVMPHLEDPALLVEVEMMLSVLAMVAVRSEHEIAWMLEEADEVGTALAEAREAGQLGAHATEALAVLEASRLADLTCAEVRRHYGLAGEALARAADESAAVESPLGATVWRLLESRLEHEHATTGVFVAVGRSENQGS